MSTPKLQTRPEAVVKGNKVEVIVKSRERVKAYGEVFTPVSMVRQMLDLVEPELETGPNFVDKTFLEPSAGDGNFLTAILKRKLFAIEKRYSPAARPAESLFALASIYGIELLADNHQAAKSAMLGEFVSFHQRNRVKCTPRTNLFRAADYLIAMNIVHGDALTSLTAAGDRIVFSWWKRTLNTPPMVQREAFTFESLRHQETPTLEFTTLPTYEPCRIDHVFKEQNR